MFSTYRVEEPSYELQTKREEFVSKLFTLVVGVDIGSTTHYARAFNWRGVEIGRVFKVSNTHDGFESLIEWMRYLMKINELTEAVVGIEPTGHYWFNLGTYLRNEGILLMEVQIT